MSYTFLVQLLPSTYELKKKEKTKLGITSLVTRNFTQTFTNLNYFQNPSSTQTFTFKLMYFHKPHCKEKHEISVKLPQTSITSLIKRIFTELTPISAPTDGRASTNQHNSSTNSPNTNKQGTRTATVGKTNNEIVIRTSSKRPSGHTERIAAEKDRVSTEETAERRSQEWRIKHFGQPQGKHRAIKSGPGHRNTRAKTKSKNQSQSAKL